ncbi:MAG: hypothetical protein UT36_C0002G0006 [Candidatus Peregrinibacteria bacterium GW2011_GWF2_39_17]|nr:MAG: hypothetical protein UT36_C0002G0006 [Candidatus Peregrinibacteria bacterium GW2011_GWF2_39_17]HCW32110.1 hypothetical protein [Candidatus Peregrinibacteria bacterium]
MDNPSEDVPDTHIPTSEVQMTKIVNNIDLAIEVTISDVEKILATRHPLIHVTGKSGAGKSVYARQLKEKLEQAGHLCSVISTDDYVERIPVLNEHKHNMAKLLADIEQFRGEGKVVVVEGIIPESSGRMSVNADYKVFFDAPFSNRVAMRIQRESMQGRDPKEIMMGIAMTAGNNLSFFAKYEGIEPDHSTNLIVNNEYQMSGNPQLQISGDNLIFDSVSFRKIILLTKKQIDGLRQLGIYSRIE